MVKKLRFTAWLLFLFCSFFFLAAGWRDGDWLIAGGSLLFLAACVILMCLPE